MTIAGLSHSLEALYRAPNLTQLRRRLSDGVAGYGFWGVSERRFVGRVTKDYFDLSGFVWDNFASRVGDRRIELLHALLQANRSHGDAEENRRLRWVTDQVRPYLIINRAADHFSAHFERCRLVEDFGLRSVDHLNVPLPREKTGHRLIWAAAESPSALKNTSQVVGLLTVYHHMSQVLGEKDRPDRLGGEAVPMPDRGSDKPVVLSAKEREVLRWAAAGKTYKDIAVITGMAFRTVRFHIEAARDRYGFATTQQAIVRAALDYGFDPLGTTQVSAARSAGSRETAMVLASKDTRP